MPRPGLLEKISTARTVGRKAFSEPPFSSSDAFNLNQAWWAPSTSTQESIGTDYQSYVNGIYKANGIVFAIIDRRQQVFSQARFQWRAFKNGRPGDLFGSTELGLLEKPWPNGTTGELLGRMEVDASLAGNFYATTMDEKGRIGNASIGNPGRRIVRLRPDWVTIVIDSPTGNYYGIDARVVAFLYRPVGVKAPTLLLPEEVIHYSPRPDPVARFRGMSWLTPVLQEIEADIAANQHKLKFFRNAAVPSLIINGIQATDKGQFDALVAMMEARHTGTENAYRNLYLTAGADAKAIGADLKQIDFKATIAGGETRLAVAGGVPAGVLGISEGLAGSTLNAGNLQAAKRLFVDITLRDMWAKAAASVENIIPVPPGANASLWYDSRDISFLREDATDDAAIKFQDAQSLQVLTMSGWEPDAAVNYIMGGDLASLIGHHQGLQSVQLQENRSPSVTPSPTPDPALNGVASG